MSDRDEIKGLTDRLRLIDESLARLVEAWADADDRERAWQEVRRQSIAHEADLRQAQIDFYAEARAAIAEHRSREPSGRRPRSKKHADGSLLSRVHRRVLAGILVALGAVDEGEAT